MTDVVLSQVEVQWASLCRGPAAINRFYFDKSTGHFINQKNQKRGEVKHRKWMKSDKEIIFVPDVPRFVLELALCFASQHQQRRPRAVFIKQTMRSYTGFTREDLEALLVTAINRISVDQSQLGKSTIRPPSSASLFPRSTTPPPPSVSQHELGRKRWPEGLRVRTSWMTIGQR